MTDTTFLVLHGLCVKKAATTEDLAAWAGCGETDLEAPLAAATDSGFVLSGRGRHMVTPAGREWLDEQYPVVFAEVRTDADFTAAYDRFEEINSELLGLMTRWQTVSVGGTWVPNDHLDEAYDESIIEELAGLHQRAVPILQAFTGPVPRLLRYITALDDAEQKVLTGNRDFLSGAKIQSYHTVWFEMHEDLLRMLGRTRKEQG